MAHKDVLEIITLNLQIVISFKEHHIYQLGILSSRKIRVMKVIAILQTGNQPETQSLDAY